MKNTLVVISHSTISLASPDPTVPRLYLEYSLYIVTEGQHLPMCGYLVDVTQELEPALQLTATVRNGNGHTCELWREKPA